MTKMCFHHDKRWLYHFRPGNFDAKDAPRSGWSNSKEGDGIIAKTAQGSHASSRDITK